MGSVFFGKAARLMAFVFCAAILLPACSAKEAQDVPSGMSVAAALRDVHRCSRISPEIHIAEAPRATDYYDVRLLEYAEDAREIFLGGGQWNNDGSGLIPEGGLTRHYRGPCPPAGQSRNYAFVVGAMSRQSAQPLAVRLYRFTQE